MANSKPDNTKSLEDGNNMDDSNKVVTLMDLLEQEKELEKEYVAVLGASDEKCCTYARGYIKRQALYSCLTCKPESRTDPMQRAGVCLACSYKCHEGHEMVELYTKRNFRCDCGTNRLSMIKCNLDRLKMEENTKNRYNQNFSGSYCICHRPYPDPDDPIDDEMIQCIMCEDWLHLRHLNVQVPPTNSFTEMICAECTEKEKDLLLHYRDISVFAADHTSDDEKDDDHIPIDDEVETNESSRKQQSPENTIDANKSENEVKMVQSEESIETEKDANILQQPKLIETIESIESKILPPTSKDEDDGLKNEINQCIMEIIEINKNKLDEIVEPPEKKQKIDSQTSHAHEPTEKSTTSNCKKPLKSVKSYVGASFWPVDWRMELCTCANCLTLYQNRNVDFLIDMDDTVLAYEEKGIAKARETNAQQNENEMKLLQQLNHTQKIDLIMGYNKMKEKLTEFLHAFVTSNQVVTEEDINRFFRMLKEKNENANKGIGKF